MGQDISSMIAEAREDLLAKAKAESKALRMNFARYLVPAYLANRVEMARICDKEIDQTGNLLGYLRQAANAAETKREDDMALITVKNGDLYRAWIAYLCRIHGTEDSTPQIRTEAFFASERAQPVPLS